MRLCALLLLVAMAQLSGRAVAEPSASDTGALAACVAAGRGEGCIGVSARACIEREGAMSRGVCLGDENAWWLDRITASLAQLRADEAAVIARAERLGWPEPVPTLDQVSAAFEAHREAACGWRAAAWDGIHAGFEEMDCRVRFNARHALWLDAQAGGE